MFDDDIDDDDVTFDGTEEEIMPSGFQKFKTRDIEWYSPFTNSASEYKQLPHHLAIDFLNDTESSDDWYVWQTTQDFMYFKRNTLKVMPKQTVDAVPFGIYSYHAGDGVDPERLVKKTIRTDTIINIGDTFETVKRDINNFLSRKQTYKEVGTPYKYGSLMYGPPGNGKSILIQQLINLYVDRAVVIYLDPTSNGNPSNLFLQALEERMPDILKIFVFEELTVATSNVRNTMFLLRFLDAEIALNDTIVLATTNFPEMLPENIVNRPSRFDDIYEFANPSDNDRRLLITHFNSREALDSEVQDTKGLSIAEIKQFCIFMRIHGLSSMEALARIKDRKQKCKKSFTKSTEKVGFGL